MMKHTMKILTLVPFLILGATNLQAHESDESPMMKQDSMGMMKMMDNMNQMMERCNRMMRQMEQQQADPDSDNEILSEPSQQ